MTPFLFMSFRSNSFKKAFFYLFPLFVYLALIFYFSSLKPKEVKVFRLLDLFAYADSILHFLEFFIFGWLIKRAVSAYLSFWKFSYQALFSVLLIIVFAFLDEYFQSFLTYRTSTVSDFFADIFGGISAILVYSWFFDRPFFFKAK